MRLFSVLPACFGIAAISAMGLTACMSTQEGESPASDKRTITEQEFEAAAGLFKATASMTVPGFNEVGVDLAQELREARQILSEAGVCDGMIGIVDDVIKIYDAQLEFEKRAELGEYFEPNLSSYPHISRMLACTPEFFEKDSSDISDEDRNSDSFGGKLLGYEELNRCICAGSGSMFGNFDAIARAEWRGFTPASVTEGGFAPASTTSMGFQPASTSGYRPSSTDGYSPSTP